MQSKMFILALATVAGSAFAQNTIVNNIPGTFVDISARPGVNALITGTAGADDNTYTFTSTVTNVCFASTTVRVATNGYVQFGGTAGSSTFTNAAIAGGTVSPVTPNTTQTLFPFWDDLYVRPADGENLHWMQGTAASFGLNPAYGNVLIVQWTRVQHYLFTTALQVTGEATFQVQVFQNPVNGVAAQMLYSDVIFDNATFDEGVTATVGFASGTTGGAGSANNVQYSFNTASAVHAGDVLSLKLPPNGLPPSVAGGVTPAAATGGDIVVFTGTVSSGLNPNSTGLAVTGDLSAVGGASSVAFHDDGLNGDAVMNDGIFSSRYTIPLGSAAGNYTIPLTVTDAQLRSNTGSIAGSIYVIPDATDLGEIGAGAGGSEVVTTFDVNILPASITWLKFSIAADVLNAGTNYMDIDTEPSGDDGAPLVGSINDTELATYTNAGVFLDTDDDDGSNWHTQLSYGDTANIRPAFGNGVAGNGRDGDLTIGTYYLAAGCFNSVFTTNFTATSTSTAAGTIQVNFRTNIPGGGGTGPCSIADVGIAGGFPGQDHILDNNDFISFITLFFAQDPIADMGLAGGFPGSDSTWDNNDFIAFINHFFDDVVACNG